MRTWDAVFPPAEGIPMLVLSRKKDEVVMLGRWMAIRVEEIGFPKVRLTTIAHIDVSVHRKEVCEAILRTEGGRLVPRRIKKLTFDPRTAGGLILGRKMNEEIWINGDEIKVMVVEIRASPKKVRLGFTAPDSLPIHRLEVFEDIMNELHAEGITNPHIIQERLLSHSSKKV